MPRWLAHALVVVGWLLTPLWAWAASFAGAWLGARVGLGFSHPVTMMAVTLGIAALAGFGVLWLWVRWMRRLPHVLSHVMAARASQVAKDETAPGG